LLGSNQTPRATAPVIPPRRYHAPSRTGPIGPGLGAYEEAEPRVHADPNRDEPGAYEGVTSFVARPSEGLSRPNLPPVWTSSHEATTAMGASSASSEIT
jgi:hypothetical protein